MDLAKILDLEFASQRHHFCKVLSKSVMVGLKMLIFLGDLTWAEEFT